VIKVFSDARVTFLGRKKRAIGDLNEVDLSIAAGLFDATTGASVTGKEVAIIALFPQPNIDDAVAASLKLAVAPAIGIGGIGVGFSIVALFGRYQSTVLKLPEIDVSITARWQYARRRAAIAIVKVAIITALPSRNVDKAVATSFIRGAVRIAAVAVVAIAIVANFSQL